MRILIVDDEPNVRGPLADYLKGEGYETCVAANAAEAGAQLSPAPDLVILDWMLPDQQGIELLRGWRAAGLEIPVILLTARTELIDKVLGLEIGSNDYVTKPFEPRELLARIRSQLRQVRRGAILATEFVEASGIRLCPKSRAVWFSGKSFDLTKTEFELLKVFLENPSQVFSRNELLQKVWGYDRYPSTRTVDTHVLQLRQKFGGERFETVHGIGYRFAKL